VKSIFVFISLLLSGSVVAQSWVSVDPDNFLDGRVKELYVDTVDNTLYVGGKFGHFGLADAKGIVKRVDDDWVTMNNNLKSYSGAYGVTAIQRYQDKIVATVWTDDGSTNLLGWFDGIQWHDLGIYRNTGTEAVRCLEVYNDLLYIGGYFDDWSVVGGIGESFVYWDGSQLYDLDYFAFTQASTAASLHDLHTWRDTLWVGGSIFFDFMNFGAFANDTMMPFDSTFNYLGLNKITRIVEWNDELYIGGRFPKTQWNDDSNLLRFDGSNFYSVGGGTNGEITDMVVHNDELWVIGHFDTVGTATPAKNVAKWDGNQWHGGESEFNSFLKTVESYNGELYLGGDFTEVDGEIKPYFVKYDCGPLDPCSEDTVEEPTNPWIENVLIYPVPTNGLLNVTWSGIVQGPMTVEVFNSIGQLVASGTTESTALEINLTAVSSGVYVLRMADNDSHLTKTIVVN
jgi:hypothetical protein